MRTLLPRIRAIFLAQIQLTLNTQVCDHGNAGEIGPRRFRTAAKEMGGSVAQGQIELTPPVDHTLHAKEAISRHISAWPV